LGTGYRDQSWVEKAFDVGPRIITDGYGGLGPCLSRGCYDIGCDNQARLGSTRHWNDLHPERGKHLHLVRDIPYLLEDIGFRARMSVWVEKDRDLYPWVNDSEWNEGLFIDKREAAEHAR
jgi:hypothetical protein